MQKQIYQMQKGNTERQAKLNETFKNSVKTPNTEETWVEELAFLVKVFTPLILLFVGVGIAILGYTGVFVKERNTELAEFGVSITLGGALATGTCGKKN